MLETDTKRRIDTARDILVGKVPDPKSQVEQITIALIYKFMDDMDRESKEMGGKASFFTGEFKRYRWSNIFDPRLGGHEMLSLYAEAIVKLNQNPGIPQLFRDIFKNAYLPYRDPETLKLFLTTINEFVYDHSENLGDAFEYLLSVLGSQGDAGQFRTPRHIIDFMVEVIDPQKNENILDPACGTAGFLISSYKHIMKANTKKVLGDLLTTSERKKLLDNFRGYDISPDMVRLSLVNLYLHGFGQPKIFEYDTLTSDERWNEYADVILANPPFMSPKGGIKPHKIFSVQSNRSEVLFVDYIAEHLTTSGRAAVIVPEGIIFQSGTAYKQIRKSLIEKYLYAVVSLPAGVFNPYAGVKTSILFLDPLLAKKSDSILFVKIENDGFSLGAQRRAIDKNDLPVAVEVIKEFRKELTQRRKGAKDAEEYKGTRDWGSGTGGSCLIVSKEKIAESGEYNLSGERYRKEDGKTGNYSWYKIKDLINTITPPCKIHKTSFNMRGRYPIIDQSKDDISGWTDDENAVIWTDKPLVVFGDHTCIVKLVDSPFVQGADGIKILQTVDSLDPRFLFFILKIRPLKNSGYQRHFSLLKEYKIPLPSIEVQREIVAEIDEYQKIIDGARQVVDNWKPHIDIDPNWPLEKLGDVCTINPKKSEVAALPPTTKVSFVPMASLQEHCISFQCNEEKLLSEVGSSYTYFKDNDVLLAKVTPCFENGKAGIAKDLFNGIGFGSSEFYILRSTENVLSEWIFFCITNPLFREGAIAQMTGTGGLQRVPRSYIENFQIPLPALEIQRTIVAEIEAEQKAVDGCRELIALYEGKIKAVIERVWGKDSNEV
jgi:type I restriction enzyme M protein